GKGHSLPDRVLLPPEQLRRTPAHQDDLHVALPNVASPQNGNAHRLEVPRREGADLDRRLITGEELRPALDHDRLHGSAGEGEVVDSPRGRDTGKRAQAL